MLYEFHHSQNAKKPGIVYATYLLEGIAHITKPFNVNGHKHDDEDAHMQSSPYLSSSMPQEAEGDVIPSRKVLLAREADLEGMKVNAKANLSHSAEHYDKLLKQLSTRCALSIFTA